VSSKQLSGEINIKIMAQATLNISKVLTVLESTKFGTKVYSTSKKRFVEIASTFDKIEFTASWTKLSNFNKLESELLNLGFVKSTISYFTIDNIEDVKFDLCMFRIEYIKSN